MLADLVDLLAGLLDIEIFIRESNVKGCRKEGAVSLNLIYLYLHGIL
jgi:hypothetical protein